MIMMCIFVQDNIINYSMDFGFSDNVLFRKALMQPYVSRRKSLGLKSNYVATRLGIAPANYTRIEQGKVACSYVTLLKICYILCMAPVPLSSYYFSNNN